MDKEKLKKNAELEAQADDAVMEEMDEQQKLLNSFPLVAELSREYEFEGKKVKKIDLEGLKDLTTRDAQYLDRVMEKANVHPVQKFKDTLFTKHVAMRVTGLPVEFFDQLSWLDMNEITNIVYIFFRFGSELVKR